MIIKLNYLSYQQKQIAILAPERDSFGLKHWSKNQSEI